MSEIIGNPVIENAVARQATRTTIASMLAERLLATKTWEDMGEIEREACVRHVVSQVESSAALADRLCDDLSFEPDDFSIDWRLSEEGDVVGAEGRLLVQALGGLVSKNGALVSIVFWDGSMF